MKILVTGHRGFIGQNLVKYIQQHTDWEVNGWEWGDSAFPKVEGNDWVIHLGAISSTAEQDVEKILWQNTEFSKILFKSCQINYVNLQYASSASVYGLKNDFKETSKCVPQNPYAWSKYLFERWIKKQGIAYGCVAQGFRYFNVYGNHEDHKDQPSPVTTFKNQALRDKQIKLFENSDQYLRDFICVDDICRVHLDFIRNVRHSGIWNLGTGKTTSFQQIANTVAKKLAVDIKYVSMPEVIKPSYQAYTCSDNTFLEKTIGPQQWIDVSEWIDQHFS